MTITDQYVDGTYLEKVKDWHVGDSPWKSGKILEMIRRNGLEPSTVYDVGCGVGGILTELQPRLPGHVQLRGYDVSPQAIAIAKPKENERLKFHNEDILASDAEKADLLLNLDVFEHLPDYLGFLQKLREHSRWFIFHIPLDISFQTIRRGCAAILEMRERYGHLHYFTKQTALATLEDTGYEVVDTFFTDDLEVEGKPPRRLRRRVVYEARRLAYRWNPDFAAFAFQSYNLMVLAKPKESA